MKIQLYEWLIAILSTILAVYILSNSSNHREVVKLNQHVTYLTLELQRCKESYTMNLEYLQCAYEENRSWNNHAVRMQYIAGVKNPDTVFTWREKVTHGLETRRLTRYAIK